MAEREPTHTAGKRSFPGACGWLLWVLGLTILSACGGSGGGTQGSGPTVTVGGRASGVQEPGLVLQLNGSHDLSVDMDRPFTFDAAVPSGSAFDVTIVQQPPSQRCELVNRGRGVAGTEPVLDVGVVCEIPGKPSSVRGVVKGVLQPGVVLTLVASGNPDQELRFDDDSVFEFAGSLNRGTSYVLEVQAPPLLVCEIFGGATGVIGRARTATVACTPRPSPDAPSHSVSGEVQGFVPRGTEVALRLNGRIQARTAGTGAFAFSEQLPAGSRYEVSVLQAPPGISCELAHAAGVVGDADITDIAVNCQTAQPATLVRGEISGLKGSGLVLKQGLETLTLSPDDTGFTFQKSPENGFYQVEIAAQPTSPAQICEFRDGLGRGFLPNNSSAIAVSLTCSTLQRPLDDSGLSLDKNSLSFSADIGGTVAAQAVFGAVNGVSLTRLPRIQASPELAGFKITVDQLQGQVAKMTVTPPTLDHLGPRTITGRITVTQCLDEACLEQAAGSPQVVNVSYTVRPSPAPRTLQVSEHGLAFTVSPEGTLLARSLTVRDSGTTAAGWLATTDAAWLSITDRGDSGGTLQVVADPSGLPDGEHQATITVRSVDPTLPHEERIRVGLFKTSAARTGSMKSLTFGDTPVVVADPVRPLFYRFDGKAIVATHAYTGEDMASLPLTPSASDRVIVYAAAPSSDGTRLYVFTEPGRQSFLGVRLTVIDLLGWRVLRSEDALDLVSANGAPGSRAAAVPAVVGGRKVVVLGGFAWGNRTARIDAAHRSHVILDGESGAVLGHLQLSAGNPDARLFAGRDPSTVFVLEPTGLTQYALRANAIGNILGEPVGDVLAATGGTSMSVSPDGRKLAIVASFSEAAAGSSVREFVVESGRFQQLHELATLANTNIDSLCRDNIGRLAVQFRALNSGSSTLDLYNLDGTLAQRVPLPSFFGGASPGISFTSDGLILTSNDQLLGVPPP